MILKVIVAVFLLYIALVILVNGLVMLVSPGAWFRLPRGLRASGGLRAETYSSRGRALEIRLAGAAVLGMMAYVGHLMFVAGVTGALSAELSQPHPVLRWVIAIFVGGVILKMLTNGLFLLISPRTWLHLPMWIRGRLLVGNAFVQNRWDSIFLRCFGAFVTALAGVFLYICFSIFWSR